MFHGSRQVNAVITSGRKCLHRLRTLRAVKIGRKKFSALCEECTMSVELIIAAVGVVISQRRVDRNAGKRGAQSAHHIGNRLLHKGPEFSRRGFGKQCREFAGEGMRNQVAAHDHKLCPARLGVDGAQTRLKQRISGVLAARVAGLLQFRELRLRIGSRGSSEKVVPFPNRRGCQLRRLPGITKWFKVNVAHEESLNRMCASLLGCLRGNAHRQCRQAENTGQRHTRTTFRPSTRFP